MLDFSTYWSAQEARCGIGNGGGCRQTNVPVAIVDRAVGADQLRISLWFFPDKIRVGQTVSLADLSALPMDCSGMQIVTVTLGGKTCAKWTGTVTYKSANPSFAFSTDLKCSEEGKSDLLIRATFRGDT